MNHPDTLIRAVADAITTEPEPCSHCLDEAEGIVDAIVDAGYRIVLERSAIAIAADMLETEEIRAHLNAIVAAFFPKFTADEEAAIASPPVDLNAYHARMQRLRSERSSILQEAPDTETDPTPPHGIRRP